MGNINEKGVHLESVPAQCQLRNGGVERAIQMAKNMLSKKLEGDLILDIQELQATFHGVSAILNQRPLRANSLAEDMETVTPAMLLLEQAGAVRTTDWSVLPPLQEEPP